VHKKSANPRVYDLNPNLTVVDMLLMCAGGSMSVYMVIENFRNGDARQSTVDFEIADG
jgi:hypothetical protein